MGRNIQLLEIGVVTTGWETSFYSCPGSLAINYNNGITRTVSLIELWILLDE